MPGPAPSQSGAAPAGGTERRSPSPGRSSLLCLAATLFLYLPVLLDPSWGGVPAIFSPVPLALAHLHAGPASGLGVALAAAAAAGFLRGPLASILFLLEAGLTGAIIAAGLRRSLAKPDLALSAAGMMLLGHMGLSLALSGGAPSSLAAPAHAGVDAFMAQIHSLGAQSAGDAAAFPLPDRETLVMLFPGILALGAFVNALLCTALTARFSPASFRGSPPIARWKLPEYLIWGLLAAGFAVMWEGNAFWGVPAALLVLLLPLYALQGIAVALHLAERRAVDRWVKVAAGLLVLLQPPLLVVFLLVGLLDFRFDFRRLGRPPA